MNPDEIQKVTEGLRKIAEAFKIPNTFIKEEQGTENMNKVKLREELSTAEIRRYEKQWLEETTPLSFNDWMYIKHNVFMYVVEHKMWKDFKENHRKYLEGRLSDPKSGTYSHFVLWLSLAKNFRFTCQESGRTTQQIITLYDEHVNTTPFEDIPEETPKAEPRRVVMRALQGMTDDEWSRICRENRDSVLSDYTYALAKHNIACVRYGANYVDAYNKSTYSDLDSGNFMSFPQYIRDIAKLEKYDTSWDELDKLWRDFNKDLLKNVKSPVLETKMARDTTPEPPSRMKKRSFSNDDILPIIEDLRVRVRQSNSAVLLKRLQMAENLLKET